MKKLLFIFSLILAGTSMQSCKQDSIQQFFIDSQEKEEYIVFDMPISLFSSGQDHLNEADQAVLNSVKKVNFVALTKKNADDILLQSELQRVKTILNNSEYQEIMQMNQENMGIAVYFIGEEDAIEEMILVAHQKEMGFGVARLIGEDMNINELMNLSQKIKIDPSKLPVEEFSSLLGV